MKQHIRRPTFEPSQSIAWLISHLHSINLSILIEGAIRYGFARPFAAKDHLASHAATVASNISSHAMHSDLMMSHAKLYFEDFALAELKRDETCNELLSLIGNNKARMPWLPIWLTYF